jgi:hypothetical protein
MANAEKRVKLVFPEPDTATLRSMGFDNVIIAKELVKGLTIDVEDFVNILSKYKVDSITVTIGAAVEAGDVIKLIVNPKLKGGVTITFKPTGTA